MDEMIYAALTGYYNTLSKVGYYKYDTVFSLLLLSFYRDFVFHDYRGILSREDYAEIERALNCLYGTDCLIPYPDYLKMGKLYLGEITEMADRLKTLEDEPVLKLVHDASTISNPDSQSDVAVIAEE